MALEIKQITKLDGKVVVRVLSPGTIYQLFQHIKKTQRDYKKFQKALADKALPTPMKDEARYKWARRSRYVTLMDE